MNLDYQGKSGGQIGHKSNSKVVKEGRELKERLDKEEKATTSFKEVEKAIRECK